MQAIQTTAKIAAPAAREPRSSFRFASAFDSDKAAMALADFLEEAREILAGIETAYVKGQEARPLERARRDMLRFLAGSHEEVELHDLPTLPSLGITGSRSMVEELAKAGLVEVSRGQPYPNMMYLEITPAGREELRRIGVKEAMIWLHELDSSVSDALGEAREALIRLEETVSA